MMNRSTPKFSNFSKVPNPLRHVSLETGDVIALIVMVSVVSGAAGWIMHAQHWANCFWPV